MRKQTLKLVTTGIFAAMITVMTAYICHIPYGMNGGYIHFGDTLIYLAAVFLPRPCALAAAAIGGGMADLLTAPVWMPATVIIKMLIVLPFSGKNGKLFVPAEYRGAVPGASDLRDRVLCGGRTDLRFICGAPCVRRGKRDPVWRKRGPLLCDGGAPGAVPCECADPEAPGRRGVRNQRRKERQTWRTFYILIRTRFM